jgi:hypothetical protein
MRFLNLVFFSFSYPSYEALCLFWEFINHLNFRIWLLSLFHLCWRRILSLYSLCPLLDSYEIENSIVKLDL